MSCKDTLFASYNVSSVHFYLKISRCSKLIAIKLCALSEMHATVRRESVAGYATDETLVCGPKEHTRWWQRYRGHLQGLLYRLILNSYLQYSVGSKALYFHTECIYNKPMTVTDIYEGINNSVGSYFEWAQAHQRHGLLVVAGLDAFWLVGLLRRWEWACRWQYYYKLWMFDACKPETKRKMVFHVGLMPHGMSR